MEKIVGKPRLRLSSLYCILLALTIIFWVAPLYIIHAGQLVKYFVFCIMIVILVIVLPGLSYSLVMWKIDEYALMYTYHYTFFDKVKSFYKHVFYTHRLEYQMIVYLAQIDYIEVDFAKVLRGPYATYGYDIIFNIYTNDGSEFRFNVLDASNRKEFNGAIELLKSKNIEFIDCYDILERLKNNSEPISYYLQDIERKKNL